MNRTPCIANSYLPFRKAHYEVFFTFTLNHEKEIGKLEEEGKCIDIWQ
jgi:hypothetical protein